eukprot:CAMPEP_0168178882 /NCGR_PEP_ID=MMETSP0139_2-20121125/9447_1 /TAXON_ID=44445 /ORGANISM="Pseudo-nitzschia australis, Strain 10249 10 AB" /LENGTH=167 /DNA_ID=CAMNT_0008098475 /DNA_START=231 /DNA_END=737 /DNA_ORIENTATION=-
MVKLVSNLDDRIFEVSMAAIQISQVCLDAAGEVDGDENEDEYDNENVKTIPLDVSGPNLEMIVDFMKHYQKEKMNEVKFSGDSFEMEVRQKWYQDFVSHEKLGGSEAARKKYIQLVKTSDYMCIQPILSLVTFKMKCEMLGRSCDEIYEYLELPKDLIESHHPVNAN